VVDLIFLFFLIYLFIYLIFFSFFPFFLILKQRGATTRYVGGVMNVKKMGVNIHLKGAIVTIF
jgi:hypothetical protein